MISAIQAAREVSYIYNISLKNPCTNLEEEDCLVLLKKECGRTTEKSEAQKLQTSKKFLDIFHGGGKTTSFRTSVKPEKFQVFKKTE